MEKSVSLVLGGGGAKGLAHIGVIKELENQGYKIESISGTSIGAIVGGFYGAGKLELYENWVNSLSRYEVAKLLDLTLSSQGFIKGNKIINGIKDILGDIAIEDLGIKYTAVATDITNEKEFWFTSGNLADAMRASMAIPNVFTPIEINGRIFVDGGVVNPVPVTPTLSDSTDITIAVSLNGKATKESILKKRKEEKEEKSVIDMALDYFDKKFYYKNNKNIIDITEKTVDILQEGIGRFKLAATPPSILIEVPKNICGIFDYHYSKELIEYGVSITKEKLKEQ